ncbi:MAG: FGGY-family carbohydrate kinase, partial [Myxococcota bacterium]
MSEGCVLGLDLGGSGARGMLLDLATGDVHCASRAVTSRGAPDTGGLGADLDLEELWSSLAAVSRAVLEASGCGAQQVVGVACTSMRFGTVVLDDRGEVLLAVPNRDARAAAESIGLAVEHGFPLQARTGHWPLPIFAAPRLRWLATKAPETWARARVVFSINDWVTWRLCGERVTDPSQAAGTLLFDLEKRDWAWDWIDRFELPQRLFPRIEPAGTRVGSLSKDAAAALGLQPGVPIALAGADSQCAMLGAGVVESGSVGAITGTTAPLQLVLDRPLVDDTARLWTEPHVVPDRWLLESNAGPIGDSLSWLARIFFPDATQPEARLLAEAANSEPGAAGLLSSVGGVVMNAREMGVPLGHLTLTHLTSSDDPDARRHVARALVEGLAFTLRANLEQLGEVADSKFSKVALAGGMSRSDIWAGLLADALDVPVEASAHAEASGLGAALCAAMGAGQIHSLSEAATRYAQPRARFEPNAERSAKAAKVYTSWKKLRADQQQADVTASGLVTPWMLRAQRTPIRSAGDRPRPRILVTADFDEASLALLRELGEVEYASYRERMRL